MNLEIKQFAIEELKADDEGRTVEGFASVFNNVDSWKDIVLPGAFEKTLKRKKSLPMLWQHEAGQVIGTWTELEERGKGLYVKGTIADTALGLDVHKLLKMGAVTGMSIGYYSKQFEYDTEKNIRKLIEIDLFEVSLVTFPANERAQVTRVKSQDGALMTEREFERFLRDVGDLSQEEAKIVVSKGYKSLLAHRDGGDQEIKHIAALLGQFEKQLTI